MFLASPSSFIMRKKTDGWTYGPTNASFTPYLNLRNSQRVAFFKGGGPANEIIGLGILEVPKSPKRGSVTSQLNGWVALPPLLPKLQNWPPGRIVAEGRIVIAIGSLLSRLGQNRRNFGSAQSVPFFAPTHFIYAKLMIRAGTTNAGCCSGGGGAGATRASWCKNTSHYRDDFER